MVWTKADYSRDKTEKAREAKAQYRVDCDRQTISLLFVVEYSPNGNVTDSYMAPAYRQEARPLVPGSVGAALAESICPLG